LNKPRQPFGLSRLSCGTICQFVEHELSCQERRSKKQSGKKRPAREFWAQNAKSHVEYFHFDKLSKRIPSDAGEWKDRSRGILDYLFGG